MHGEDLSVCSYQDRSLADKGLVSYRYAGRYGYIMIGARDAADAMNEVKRAQGFAGSYSNLAVWEGEERGYQNAVCELAR